jgi:uncharacterized protein
MRERSPLQIKLHEIPAGGLHLEEDLSGEWAQRVLGGTDAEAEGALLAAVVDVHRVEETVDVRGRLSGDLQIPCARCLTPAPLSVDAPFHMTLVPRPDPDEAAAEELELAEEDLDFATYADDLVDLDSILREQVLLALPMTHLCREDCKGLCPQCGKDWNEGACDCPPAPRDDRWAALRNVKL